MIPTSASPSLTPAADPREARQRRRRRLRRRRLCVAATAGRPSRGGGGARDGGGRVCGGRCLPPRCARRPVARPAAAPQEVRAGAQGVSAALQSRIPLVCRRDKKEAVGKGGDAGSSPIPPGAADASGGKGASSLRYAPPEVPAASGDESTAAAGDGGEAEQRNGTSLHVGTAAAAAAEVGGGSGSGTSKGAAVAGPAAAEGVTWGPTSQLGRLRRAAGSSGKPASPLAENASKKRPDVLLPSPLASVSLTMGDASKRSRASAAVAPASPEGPPSSGAAATAPASTRERAAPPVPLHRDASLPPTGLSGGPGVPPTPASSASEDDDAGDPASLVAELKAGAGAAAQQPQPQPQPQGSQAPPSMPQPQRSDAVQQVAAPTPPAVPPRQPPPLSRDEEQASDSRRSDAQYSSERAAASESGAGGSVSPPLPSPVRDRLPPLAQPSAPPVRLSRPPWNDGRQDRYRVTPAAPAASQAAAGAPAPPAPAAAQRSRASEPPPIFITPSERLLQPLRRGGAGQPPAAAARQAAAPLLRSQSMRAGGPRRRESLLYSAVDVGDGSSRSRTHGTSVPPGFYGDALDALLVPALPPPHLLLQQPWLPAPHPAAYSPGVLPPPWLQPAAASGGLPPGQPLFQRSLPQRMHAPGLPQLWPGHVPPRASAGELRAGGDRPWPGEQPPWALVEPPQPPSLLTPVRRPPPLLHQRSVPIMHLSGAGSGGVPLLPPGWRPEAPRIAASGATR